MYEDTLRIGGEQLPYFRTGEFSAKMLKIERNFLELMKAPVGSRLAILTASGTGAMEAAVINTLTEEDKVLVIDGGGFGHRFGQICACHKVPYTYLTLEFGEALTAEHLLPYENQGYTALLVNLDETSTCQLYDGAMLGEFCRRNDMYYIVDAISIFLADEFLMEEWGVDLVITASQKALALAPGLSFIVANKRIIEERILPHEVGCMYFDLKDIFKNMERGQTPFTPAVGIILQLEERLRQLVDKGIDFVVEEHRQKAAYFRHLCKVNEIPLAEYPMSNAVTALLFPDENAQYVFETMKNQYGMTLTPNGGALGPKILRVGHLGNLTKEDYTELVKNLKEVL